MSARAARTKRLSVELDGEAFDLWYLPGKVSPLAIRELKELSDDDDSGFASALGQIRRFVTQWDVVDDAGERIAPTDPRVEAFDVAFLVAVIRAIGADLSPNPTTSTNSGSFS